MKRTHLTLTLLCGALLGSSMAATPARADRATAARASSERAASLFQEANRLYAGKNLGAAEPLYREAWDSQRTYDIACNFGALELDLGKAKAAAELLDYALRHFPVRGQASERDALEARFDLAKKRVSTVRVRVDAPDVEIFVDGRSVGRAPLADEIFLEPGERLFEVKAGSFTGARQSVNLGAGTTRELSLAFRTPPKRSAIPAIVAGSLGAAALGTGLAFIAVAESKRSAAETQSSGLQQRGLGCASPSPSCDELHSLTRSADAFGNAGIGALIGAGAAAAGVATYLLWPSSSSGKLPAARSLGANFGAAPSGGFVSISGSF